MLRWRDPVMKGLVDALRLSMRACLLIDGIIVSVFSVWFVGKSVLKLADWLNVNLFTNP